MSASESGRLRPAELAEAAVLADLAVLVIVLARLTPFAGATNIVGAIPFAVLGLRHRTRVLAVGYLVATILTFLMAGFSSATQVIVMAMFGGIVGRGIRFGWSKTTTVTMAIALGWTTVSALTVGYLFVFDELRELTIEAATVQWAGVRRTLEAVRLGALGDLFDPAVTWALGNWYLSIPIFQLAVSVGLTLFVRQIGRPAIERVDKAFPLAQRPSGRHATEKRPVPERIVPLRVEGAEVERGGTVVRLPSFEILEQGLSLVVGPNGVGKSTLLGALIGRHELRSGTIEPVGLEHMVGVVGGVGVIGQRPESQILGARVLDDMVWGFDDRPSDDEVAHALARVGLGGFERRETGGLSGGELQRLAVAAALLRRPALLLSDESTAMLDPLARRQVMDTLRTLAETIAVVHVTHIDDDVRPGDRVIDMTPVAS